MEDKRITCYPPIGTLLVIMLESHRIAKVSLPFLGPSIRIAINVGTPRLKVEAIGQRSSPQQPY